MKNHYFVAFVGLFLACSDCMAARTKGIVPPTITQTVGNTTVSVETLADGILHLVKYVGDERPVKKSYSVIMEPQEVKAPKVTATIDEQTGCVTFTTADGTVLLRETAQPQLELRHDKGNEGKFRIGQAWLLDGEEEIFGLGQLRDEAMSWRGREIDLWNHNTYIAIPYFTSEKGYGLYWDNAGKSRFTSKEQGGNGKGQEVTFSSEVAPCIDYYFLYQDGTQDGVIACIRQLTGQATMFPLWTLGHWQCRERYKSSDELATALDKYRALKIPLDGIVQDWQYWGCDSNWNAMRFMNPYYINKVSDPAWAKYLPDDLKKLAEEYKAKGLEPRLKSPQEMTDYVRGKNAHLMISIWSSFGPWTEPYKELKAIGGLLPFDTWPLNKGVMPYDAFNPKARDIYWKYLSHLYEMGFDAWWTDSTEPDHFNESAATDAYQTYDGTWLSVKNAFPLMTNKGIYEHQRAAEALKIKKLKNKNYKGKRSVQMTRSGTFGLQHYGTFSWSGDVNASWKEMKNQIPSGLNYSLCGIPFWNTDIGGFFYWDYWNDPKNPALQELHTRWMQWGAFMPLMRNHCSSPMVSELYEFGEEGDWAYDAMVGAVKLRYRLLPYLYSMAGDVVQHSGSIMRPLVMDFAKDKKAICLNDEYMFGRALLVKPVTDPMFTWREDQRHGHEIYPEVQKAVAPVSVYLPQGVKGGDIWYDFFTNKVYEGGKTVLRPTSINDMPVFVCAGSILPFGPEVQYATEKAWDDLEIRIYPGADGTFTLYEDECDGYGYERGLFTEIPFEWDDASHTLTIGARKGQFPGMLARRTFNVVAVGNDSGRGDQPMKGAREVVYEGKEIVVKM